jgi:hypothetical protein
MERSNHQRSAGTSTNPGLKEFNTKAHQPTLVQGHVEIPFQRVFDATVGEGRSAAARVDTSKRPAIVLVRKNED